jgi:hypothetical protein
MEINEYILMGIGICISIISFFLKRENKRLEDLENLVNKINLTLAKNDVRDNERWESINKRLEDRRTDIRKIYDIISDIKSSK